MSPVTRAIPTEDAALASFLTRVETKLDTVLTSHTDHEARIRILEERRTVAPRDLWFGITGAIAAAAALSTVLSNLTP